MTQRRRRKATARNLTIAAIATLIAVALLVGNNQLTTYRCNNLGELSEYNIQSPSEFRAWNACAADTADAGRSITLTVNAIKGNQYAELLDWSEFLEDNMPSDGFQGQTSFTPPGAETSYYARIFTVTIDSPADQWIQENGGAGSLESKRNFFGRDGTCDGTCAAYDRMIQNIQGEDRDTQISYTIGPTGFLEEYIKPANGWTCQYQVGLQTHNGDTKIVTGEGAAEGFKCRLPSPEASGSSYDTRVEAEFTTTFTGIPDNDPDNGTDDGTGDGTDGGSGDDDNNNDGDTGDGDTGDGDTGGSQPQGFWARISTFFQNMWTTIKGVFTV